MIIIKSVAIETFTNVGVKPKYSAQVPGCERLDNCPRPTESDKQLRPNIQGSTF